MSWPENLAKLTIEELADLYRTNETWSNDLKLRVKILMDGKAVGVIGEHEYDISIKSTNKDIAECIRRRQLLGKL